jgi:hypothetical protein
VAIIRCCTPSYAASSSSSNLSGSKFCSGLKISRTPMWRSIASRMIASASGITSAGRSFFAVSPCRSSAVRARSCSSVSATTFGSKELISSTIRR